MFLESHPDFIMTKEFISSLEEINLINEIMTFGCAQFSCGEEYGRENILRFGKFKNTIQNVISAVIPNSIQVLANRLKEYNLIDYKIEAISINEYLPNQGINPHIDSKSSGDVITILGFGSHTALNFTHNKKEAFSVYFPARCVLQFKNKLRTEWQHSIKPQCHDEINGERIERKKRYSIVFRQALI